MQKIQTSEAPAAIGPYSQGIVSNGLVYVSGQIPVDPKTGAFAGSTIEEQAKQSINNVEAVLRAAGSDLSRVVKTTCFLKNLGDFATFNSIYESRFIGKPARSCVEVSALPKGALVEIEAIAEI